jgi:hypothetical protein
MNKLETIKLMNQRNPSFINDILHLHYFKTDLYFTNRMNDFPLLKISGELKWFLHMVKHATAYTFEGGKYTFEMEKNWLGMDSLAPFPLIFNSLISSGYGSKDIPDLINKCYESKNPISIYLAELFKEQSITLVTELFDFISRKECNFAHEWDIDELLEGEWNFTLLSLNEKVWKSAINCDPLISLFSEDKIELDEIEEGELLDDGYPDYLLKIDRLIKERLG